MNHRKSNYKFLLVFITFITSTFFLSYAYIIQKEKTLLHETYQTLANEVKKGTNTLIDNKKNATMAITIALSKDINLINSLKEKMFKNLDFKSISKELKENTNYQNLWIQLIDKDGYSKYRSWTNKKNDLIIETRKDLEFVLKNKKNYKVISTGLYGMSFKAIVPIFNDGKLLGIIESITKFNSISKSLSELGFDAIISANKESSSKIKYPFSEKFIDGYYIANINASEDIINSLESKDLENYFKLENYKIIDNYFITNLKIEKNIGNILLFKKLSSIDVKSISDFKRQAFILVFVLLFLLVFITVTYLYQSHSKSIEILNKKLIKSIQKLKSQKKKTQSLLDSQLNIIIITNGVEILNSNRQLLNFFKDCKTLKEFKSKYICICTKFVSYKNDANYILDIDYDGQNWAEFILSKPRESFKAAIYDSHKKLRHFALNVSQDKIDSFIIVTLTDITYDIEVQEKLKKFNSSLEKSVNEKTIQLQELNENLEIRIEEEIQRNKKKDKLIFQQNKMNSIAQMMSNVAHQWRQPLNAITTASSAMLLHKELDVLDDSSFENSCKMIIDKSKYLSSTIDSFENIFTDNEVLCNIKVENIVNQSLNFINIILEEKLIKLVLQLDKDFEISIYEKEFKQALLNILHNSVDSLVNNTKEEDRVIYIKMNKDRLIIEDSGKGINKDIIDRVFEPYFTTKHQSQGVGMGLYIVQEILSTQMDFKIDVNNTEFIYNNKLQKGLQFIIYLK